MLTPAFIAVALLVLGCDRGGHDRPKATVNQPQTLGDLRIEVTFSESGGAASRVAASILDSGLVVARDSLGADVAQVSLTIDGDTFSGTITGLEPQTLSVLIGFFQGDTLRWVGTESDIIIQPGQLASASLSAKSTLLQLGGDSDTSPGFEVSLAWTTLSEATLYELEASQDPSFENTQNVYRGQDSTLTLDPSIGEYFRVRLQHDFGDGIWSSAHHVEVAQPVLSGPPESIVLVAGEELDLSVINSGSGLLTWRIMETPNWLELSDTADTTESGAASAVGISLVAGLVPGVYQDTLRFVTNSASGIVELVISAEIEAAPVLSVGDTVLAFPGSATVAQLPISNVGTGDLTVTVSSSDAWLSIEPSDAVIGAGEEVQFTVRATKSCLPAGNRQGQILVQSEVGLREILVEATVPNLPSISIPTIQNRIEVSSESSDATITLSNSGFGLLEWRIANEDLHDWLLVSPLSGTTLCETDEISIHAEDSRLDARQAHLDTLRIESGNEDVEAVEILIEFHVARREELTVSAEQIDFGLSGQVESIQLHNLGTIGTDWQIERAPDWLEIQPIDGSVAFGDSNEITLTVRRAALPEPDESGELVIGFGDSSVTVEITASRPIPIAVLGDTALDFGTAEDTLTVILRNDGSAPLVWTVPELPDWISLETSVISIAPADEQVLILVVDRSVLISSFHEEVDVQISSNSHIPIPVLAVSVDVPFAVFEAMPGSIVFAAKDTLQRLTITNEGTADLDWQITHTPEWIGVNPSTNVIEPGAGVTVDVTIRWPGFSSGESRTDSLIVESNAPDSPHILTVNATSNSVPTANAGEDLQIKVGVPSLLDGSGSHDPDGDGLVFRWSVSTDLVLSDSTSAAPTVTSSSIGEYSAILVVSDGTDTSEPDTVVVSVMTNASPVANAGPDIDGQEGDVFSFDGSRSSDSDGTIVSFLWDFGDGTVAEGRTADHGYLDDGSYLTTLIATDDNGALDTDTVLVAVTNVAPSVEAGGPYSGEVGVAISMTGVASDPGIQDALSYSWDLGDGNTGDGEVITHTYAQAGSFSVVLTVSDGDGASATDSAEVTLETPTMDGNRALAFTSDRDGEESLFVMNDDGSAINRVVSRTWTPTDIGGSVVTQRVADWSQGNVISFVVGADLFAGLATGGEAWEVASGSWRDISPAISPDGSEIAFVTDRDGSEQIYLAPVEGGAADNLTSNNSGNWAPAWSPDGTKLAFVSIRGGNWDIYVMNRDGSGVAQLTTDASDESDPAWSPDGRSLSFVSNRDGRWQIYSLDLTDFTQARIGGSLGNDYGPKWSPDGARIAFTSDRDGDREVFVMSADGTDAKNISRNPSATDVFAAWGPATFAVEDAGPIQVPEPNLAPVPNAGSDQTVTVGEIVQLDGNDSSDPEGDALAYEWQQVGGPQALLIGAATAAPTFVPEVSGIYLFTLVVRDPLGVGQPDQVQVRIEPRPLRNGPQIVFRSRRADPPNDDIWLMNADGSDPIRLTFDGSSTGPSWSPDGSSIVFRSGRGGDDIYVMDIAGTYLRNLTIGGHSDHDPAWSPDGTRIAFASNGTGTVGTAVWLMNADGSGRQNLIGNQQLRVTAPFAWSPDGDRIAFSAKLEPDNNFDIWTMNADGSDQTRLTTHGADDRSPDWSPDGSKIAFVSLRSSADGRGDIYVINVDGTNPERLTTGPSGEGGPSWSADGTKIVFSSDQDGNQDIYVMDADGSGETRLTSHPEADVEPRWIRTLETTIPLNGPPIADAGPNLSSTVGHLVQLDGGDSSDPDGDELQFTWIQIDGPEITMDGDRTVEPVFTPIEEGDYIFELNVSDGAHESTSDTVSVSVGPDIAFFEDFEGDLSQWIEPYNSIITQDESYEESGSQTFEMTSGSGETTAHSVGFEVEGGTTYYFHVAYMTLGGGGLLGFDELASVDAVEREGASVWLFGDGGAGSLQPFPYNVDRQDNDELSVWKVYSQEYTIPSGVRFIRVVTKDFQGGLPNDPIGAGVFFDNIEVTTSSIPSFSVETRPARPQGTVDVSVDGEVVEAQYNGYRIAFYSDRAARPGIYTMRVDGTDQRMVKPAPAHAPRWTPEGNLTYAIDGRSGLYEADADGSGERLVSTLGNSPHAWSPDMARVAFVHTSGEGRGVHVSDASNLGEAVFLSNGGGPTWSPDGTRVAYRDGSAGISIFDFRDSTEVSLTRHGSGARWSPSEDVILFVSQETGSYEIWTVDVISGQQVQITDDSSDNDNAEWSSDGSKIVFRAKRDGFRGLDEIYIMDANGDNQMNISQHPANDLQPSWSPVRVED
jgi:Tol biopolymer transport system component